MRIALPVRVCESVCAGFMCVFVEPWVHVVCHAERGTLLYMTITSKTNRLTL